MIELSKDSESIKSDIGKYKSLFQVDRSPIVIRSPLTNRTSRSLFEQPKSPTPLKFEHSREQKHKM